MLAQLTNIEKTFGKRTIFEKLNLTVYPNERIGFIGANGAGKSTLFKILTGQLTPDDGDVSFAANCKVGHLTQDPVLDPENAVIDEAELAFAKLHDLAHELRDLEHEMGHLEGDELEKVLAKYQDVQHEFDLGGGYVWHHRLEATLQGVGLERETWEQKVSTLSGGQKSRLALAKVLIAEPDLLLLDEPTNHLDLAAIEWLENYLAEFKGAAIIISHDRYLLDRLATRVIWLTQYKLNSYPGNYSAFVEQKDLHELSQQRAYEQQQEDIEKQKEFVRRFGAGQRAREAKGREKRLNRLLESEQLIQSVQSQKTIALSINTDQRAGDQVLSVRELSKAFDQKKLWEDIGFEVKRGERIGIIGPNGSGKTTLLKCLVGRGDADGGKIKWGANLNIGYYDQQLGEFNPDNTVFEEVREGRPVKEQEVRNLLGSLLFSGDDIYKEVRLLSGGERARVRLAQLLLDKPNVLVLDEPTNHLDIASCQALEGALKSFPGTILCVSHDRYFLDHAVERMLILDPPGVVDFEGNYSAWNNKQKEKAAAEAAAAKKAKGGGAKPQPAKQATSAKPAVSAKPQASSKSAAQKKDNPYARRFGKLEVGELEREIAKTETAVAENQAKMANPGTFRDAGLVKRLQSEGEELAKKLEELEAEYFLRAE